MAFAKDLITRTVPLSPFPPFLIPHSLAYKQAYEVAGRRNLSLVGLAAAGGGLLQLAFPATAVVREHIIDSRSDLHDVADRSPLPSAVAAALDVVGLASAVALMPHVPQLHMQLPFTNWDIPTGVSSFVEAKLAVNLVTNSLAGAVEADVRNNQNRRRNTFDPRR